MSKMKKVIITDEDALQSLEELQETTEEPSDEEIEELFSQTPFQVTELPPIETNMVEVIPLRDDNFSFGGTWYHFSKGKRQLVPTHVRDFLLMNKQSPRIKDIY